MSADGAWDWQGAFRRHRGTLLLALIASLTLGLAPFYPQPHVYKQIVNLIEGRLEQAMDIFDLAMHGAPWVVLLVMLVRVVLTARRGPTRTTSR